MAAGEVTRILGAVRRGDARALDDLFPLVERELRALTRYQVDRRSPTPTLSPTALVNEAYVQLNGSGTGEQQR